MKFFYPKFFFKILILIKPNQCRILCALCSHSLMANAPDSLPPAGVVLLDKNQGFWLVHSTPHFPPVQKAQFSYPCSGVVNGQNFICVTYPLERFQTIGKTGGRMRAKVKLGPKLGHPVVSSLNPAQRSLLNLALLYLLSSFNSLLI